MTTPKDLSAADLDTKQECDHEWVIQDDSFDHEYGTEVIRYFVCKHCDAVRDIESGDYDD